MTPAELRTLANEATPGPWRTGWTPGYLSALQEMHLESGYASSLPLTLRSDAHTEEIATVWNYLLPTVANATLIALSPDLARLCAEQHEALSWALSSLQTVLERRPHKAIPEMRACAEAALAKLAELKP